jgi:hypothetical protein
LVHYDDNALITVSAVADQGLAFSLKLLRDQGLPAADTTKYELDHFIPLALGGHPRKPENLWLQLWDGQWGARTKDRF